MRQHQVRRAGSQPQRINLCYDDQHYHVITKLTAAVAKEYVCPACNKGCRIGVQHRYEASCGACSAIPPCIQDNARIPWTSIIDTSGTRRAMTITRA